MADTDPIETTSKPIKGKLTVERKMMLRGKDYVGIRLDQSANAVDLNCFQVKEEAQRTSLISLFKEKQTAPLADVELKQQQT